MAKYIAKGEGQTFLCKGCHATDVMIGRHFGKLPSVWDRLTEEEQVQFYRQVLTRKEAGPLRFKTLRTDLKEALVRRSIEETRTGWKGQYEPLEAYRLRGYDTEKIKNLADKQVHPILGDTYRVDINTFSRESIEQDIEELLNQVDKKVQRSKMPNHMREKPKAKAKGKNKKGKTNEPEVDEEQKEDEAPPQEPDPVFVDLACMESDDEVVVSCLVYVLFFQLGGVR